MTQLDQSRALTQLQHLEEQPRQPRQMALAKLRDAVVIRMLVGSQNPKGHIVVSSLLDLARRHPPSAITVNQQLDHQRRMIRRPSAQVVFVAIQDLAQIQLLDYIADIQRQVIIAQPFAQVRRQQQPLAQIVRAKRFSHGPKFTDSLIRVHDFFPTDS